MSEIFSLDVVQTLRGREKKHPTALRHSSLLEKEGFKQVSYKISSRIAGLLSSQVGLLNANYFLGYLYQKADPEANNLHHYGTEERGRG